MPRFVMGIDIGSTSSKYVILKDGQVAAEVVVPVGAGTSGPARAEAEALEKAGIDKEQLAATVATGYGRGNWQGANDTRSELICHARAVAYLCPGAHTVIDIGGQDAKVMVLDDNGRMTNFVMNDKCAAGTGRFLDVMARILEMRVNQLEMAASLSTKRVDISSTCTVFAESEVVSHLAAAENVNDIVAGIHRSVASRVAGLAKRAGIQPKVVMTGGVALNGGVVQALSDEIGYPIEVVHSPQTAGALGAALYADEMAK